MSSESITNVARYTSTHIEIFAENQDVFICPLGRFWKTEVTHPEQSYTGQVYDKYVIKGNTAVLQCRIPSYVSDDVIVTSWLTEDDEKIDLNSSYGCGGAPGAGVPGAPPPTLWNRNGPSHRLPKRFEIKPHERRLNIWNSTTNIETVPTVDCQNYKIKRYPTQYRKKVSRCDLEGKKELCKDIWHREYHTDYVIFDAIIICLYCLRTECCFCNFRQFFEQIDTSGSLQPLKGARRVSVLETCEPLLIKHKQMKQFIESRRTLIYFSSKFDYDLFSPDLNSRYSAFEDGYFHIRDVQTSDDGLKFWCQMKHLLSGDVLTSSSSGTLHVKASVVKPCCTICIFRGVPSDFGVFILSVCCSLSPYPSHPTTRQHNLYRVYSLRRFPFLDHESLLLAYEVFKPRGSMPPQVLHSKQEVRIQAGQNGQIPCVAEGYPPPNISNLKSMDSITVVYPTFTSSDVWTYSWIGSLVILEATRDDSGLYECYISNSVGNRRTTTKLVVSARLAATIIPKQQVVDIGQSATLNCSVTGFPVENVEWRKNGYPLERNGMTSAHLLNINSMSRNDGGMYQCFVANDVNSVQATSQVLLGANNIPIIRKSVCSNVINSWGAGRFGLPISCPCMYAVILINQKGTQIFSLVGGCLFDLWLAGLSFPIKAFQTA
ncbi:Down syndrome cell adhesion molecule [Nymphon striatum]|nr:Down syndrome cell adhesion molecule [Nymphon striatum]